MKKKIETTYKDFLISDIFELPSIKGITQAFIEDNKGNIPVYGSKSEHFPMGCIADNLVDVKYFENCLGWNRNGSTGYVFIHNR